MGLAGIKTASKFYRISHDSCAFHLFSHALSSRSSPSRTCSGSCAFARRPYRKSLKPPIVLLISLDIISASSSNLLISSSISSIAPSISGKMEVKACGLDAGRFDVGPNNYIIGSVTAEGFVGIYSQQSQHPPRHLAPPSLPPSVLLPLPAVVHSLS